MKSLPVPKATGTSLRPLAPVVALPSIPPGLPCSKEVLVALLAICNGLLGEMLSPDAMYLAMLRARSDAEKAGVSDEAFMGVVKLVEKQWQARRAGNPLSKMF